MSGFDRFAPCSPDDHREAFKTPREIAAIRGPQPDTSGPEYHPGLKDATPAEAAAIRKLRNTGGWWEGDANAVRVLRAFADVIRAEARPASQPQTPS